MGLYELVNGRTGSKAVRLLQPVYYSPRTVEKATTEPAQQAEPSATRRGMTVGYTGSALGAAAHMHNSEPRNPGSLLK